MISVRLAVNGEMFFVNHFDPDDIGGFFNALSEYGLEHSDGFRYKVRGYPQFVTALDNVVSLVFEMEEA